MVRCPEARPKLVVITSFNPTGGPVGTVVIVSGKHLRDAILVTVNGLDAPFVLVSNSTVRVTVPPDATTGRIRLSTPVGTAESATDFLVTSAPPPPSPEDQHMLKIGTYSHHYPIESAVLAAHNITHIQSVVQKGDQASTQTALDYGIAAGVTIGLSDDKISNGGVDWAGWKAGTYDVEARFQSLAWINNLTGVYSLGFDAHELPERLNRAERQQALDLTRQYFPGLPVKVYYFGMGAPYRIGQLKPGGEPYADGMIGSRDSGTEADIVHLSMGDLRIDETRIDDPGRIYEPVKTMVERIYDWYEYHGYPNGPRYLHINITPTETKDRLMKALTWFERLLPDGTILLLRVEDPVTGDKSALTTTHMEACRDFRNDPDY